MLLSRGAFVTLSDQLKRLDYAVYRAERALVVASLLIMAIVVFLDVVHRGFGGEASKFAEVGVKVAGLFGMLPAEDAPERVQAVADMTDKLAGISPYFLFVFFTSLSYFGIRTSKRAEAVPPPTAALYAVAGVLATYGLVRLLIWALPNGLIWSQPMSLVLTLWVGFIGASMCTYEKKHLKVEAVQRHIPDKYKPIVGFISHAMTTVACLALLWVSLRYVIFNYGEYVDTEGKGGLVNGWDVPRYQAFAALPVAFGMMSLRFGARAVLAIQGKIEEGDTLGLPKEGMPQPLPSEVETEAVRAGQSHGDAAQSEIDTMTSHSSGGAVPPPSKVQTDPHQKVRRESAKPQPAAAGAIGGDSEPDDEPDSDEEEDSR